MQPTRRELLCGSLATLLALNMAGIAIAGQESSGTTLPEVEPAPPLAPEYKQIVASTQEMIELAFLKAAASQADPQAYPLPGDPNSLERICLRFLEGVQKSPAKAAKAAKAMPQKAVALLKSPKFISRNYKLSRVALNTQTPVLAQARQQQLLIVPRVRPVTMQKGADIDEGARFRLLLEAGVLRPEMVPQKYFKAKDLGGRRASATAEPAVPGATQLLLNLRSLKCRNLVNMELTDIGPNIMALGGMGASSSGEELRIGSFGAGTFERVNQTKDFRPDRTFARFNLTGNGDWPRTYSVVVAAAEKDADGGFVKFLQDLWDGIKDVVTELVTAAVLAAAGGGALAGGAAGSAVPGLGTVIGAIIGAALAGTIAYIVSVGIESFKDDMFDPIALPTIVLPNASARFPNGSLKSRPFTVQLTQATALYELSCQWELVGV